MRWTSCCQTRSRRAWRAKRKQRPVSLCAWLRRPSVPYCDPLCVRPSSAQLFLLQPLLQAAAAQPTWAAARGSMRHAPLPWLPPTLRSPSAARLTALPCCPAALLLHCRPLLQNEDGVCAGSGRGGGRALAHLQVRARAAGGGRVLAAAGQDWHRACQGSTAQQGGVQGLPPTRIPCAGPSTHPPHPHPTALACTLGTRAGTRPSALASQTWCLASTTWRSTTSPRKRVRAGRLQGPPRGARPHRACRLGGRARAAGTLPAAARAADLAPACSSHRRRGRD